jgi:AcrR family transcriptional regulator
MTPTPHPPRRRHPDCGESLRQEILDAARELFVAEGYGSVSLRKIAQRVGCTPMAIYCHFEDKADILDCICEETFTRFAVLSDRLDRAGLPPHERLRAGLLNYLEFGLAHPHHYQLTFMTPQREPMIRREQIGRHAFDRLRRQIAACLEASGSGQDDSVALDVTSQLIWASIHGLISLWIARPEFPWAERERLIAAVVDNALERLGCAEPGGRAREALASGKKGEA